MPIVTNEIQFFRPASVSDSGGNGGRLSPIQLADNVKNQVWPDVDEAERVAGSTKYRKIFVKVANDSDIVLQNPKIIPERHSPGDDAVLIFPGTFDDTQASITGSERVYGSGQLNADVSVGASVITVATEGAALGYFQDGDLIRISDKPDVLSAGNAEYHTIAASGVSYAGDVATITITGTLANPYTAAATRVASVIEPADIAGAYSAWVETSAAGTYDEATYPPEVDHIGGVSQIWTLTFTGATTFNVVGDVLGSVGSGSTGADFSPNNPDFSKPYFILRGAGFGGTWANGETISFRTDPAATPVWEKRIVPAGAGSLSGNTFTLAVDGESAA